MEDHTDQGGDVFAERRSKLAAWRETGAVYPTQYQPRDEIATLRDAYEHSRPGRTRPRCIASPAASWPAACTARCRSWSSRTRPASCSSSLRSTPSARRRYAALEQIDLGDFVGAEGVMMRTRRGELSLRITSWQLLSKSLRPMPEKFHGLTDVETRYRKRFLDLMVNDASREVFLKRARIIKAVRDFLDARGFVEVETPVLQPLYGGAMARPFVTHHNELQRDLYLRIATELYLKRCIVGGIDRVYEIGKDFRNEGVSFKHNPEFTMLETYEAYVDYNHVMDMVEEMTVYAARVGRPATGRVPRQHDRLHAAVAAPHHARVHPPRDRHRHRRDPRRARGCRRPSGTRAWATSCRRRRRGAPRSTSCSARRWSPSSSSPSSSPSIRSSTSPFAKKTPHDPRFVERFEGYIAGMELSNAFSELNDPEDQRERFLQQMEDLAAGDETAHRLDEDFLEAMEHGMPPTGGLGMGLDRLVMVLTGRAVHPRRHPLPGAARASTPRRARRARVVIRLAAHVSRSAPASGHTGAVPRRELPRSRRCAAGRAPAAEAPRRRNGYT